ncbi:sugar ABC transporter permease, partial [Achromobacter sp. SIMBA_011]
RVITDDPDFWHSIRVTSVFTVFSVFFTMILAMGLALLLAGADMMRVSVRTLLVIPFAMSPALLGISWRFLFNPEFGAFAAVVGA